MGEDEIALSAWKSCGKCVTRCWVGLYWKWECGDSFSEESVSGEEVRNGGIPYTRMLKEDPKNRFLHLVCGTWRLHVGETRKIGWLNAKMIFRRVTSNVLQLHFWFEMKFTGTQENRKKDHGFAVQLRCNRNLYSNLSVVNMLPKFTPILEIVNFCWTKSKRLGPYRTEHRPTEKMFSCHGKFQRNRDERGYIIQLCDKIRRLKLSWKWLQKSGRTSMDRVEGWKEENGWDRGTLHPCGFLPRLFGLFFMKWVSETKVSRRLHNNFEVPCFLQMARQG